MDSANLSRRSLLQAIAAVIASAATPIGWTEAAAAMEQAHAASLEGGDATISFLTTAEALDVEAVAAQIVPTDEFPGAREAGAVYFIDRALATFFSQLAGDYRAQLASFQASYREGYPAAAPFASLPSEQQLHPLRSSRDLAVPPGSRRRDPRSGGRAARPPGAGRATDVVGAPARHVPDGRRSAD